MFPLIILTCVLPSFFSETHLELLASLFASIQNGRLRWFFSPSSHTHSELPHDAPAPLFLAEQLRDDADGASWVIYEAWEMEVCLEFTQRIQWNHSKKKTLDEIFFKNSGWRWSFSLGPLESYWKFSFWRGQLRHWPLLQCDTLCLTEALL